MDKLCETHHKVFRKFLTKESIGKAVEIKENLDETMENILIKYKENFCG